MTFKHVKFEDSPIMRSLEGVAKEKGLVKPEPPLQKTAALKKADVTPTLNLMENIFKLCAGLREQGQVQEAMEIETNYLNFKQAQTLYETSKEEGKDLIEAAHPKGSHKMENIDSDEATFEDILDKHVKMMQVMEKKPTGKLSSSAQILEKVKVALGGPPLVSGRANSSRKIAQDAGLDPDAVAAPAPGSSAVSQGLGTAEVVGGAAGLAWLGKKLLSPKGVDAQVLRAFKSVMRRSPTKLELTELRQQASQRGMKEAMKRVFGEDATEALQKESNQLLKQIAQQTKGVAQTAQPAAEEAAVGEAEPAVAAGIGEDTIAGGGEAESAVATGIGEDTIAGAGEAAVGEAAAGEAAVAGGEAAAVGAGATEAGGLIAALSGPVGWGIAAAIVAGVGAYALFNHDPGDFKKAGENLISQLADVRSEMKPQETVYVSNFTSSFQTALKLYPVIDQIKEKPTPQNIKALQSLNTAIYNSRKYAQSILSSAEKNESWYSTQLTGGWADVTAVAPQYMKCAEQTNAVIDDFLQKADQKAQEVKSKQQTQQVATSGGQPVVDLNNLYTSLQQDITNYTAIVNAKNPVNKGALLDWLTKVEAILNRQKAAFTGAKTSQPVVAKIYSDKANVLKSSLDKFKNKWANV